MTAKTKSRTEAQWAAKGFTRIGLRIPTVIVEQFRAAAKENGQCLTDYIVERVLEAEETRQFTTPLTQVPGGIKR